MLTSEPPFAPPYKARIVTDGGERWVEVAADGSQKEVSAPLSLAFLAPAEVKPAIDRKSKPGMNFLNVPYAEKDEAKRLGARWDATRKKWYVPNGVDTAAFSRWLAPTEG